MSGEIFTDPRRQSSKQVDRRAILQNTAMWVSRVKTSAVGNKGVNQPMISKARDGYTGRIVLSVSFSHNSHTDVVRADIQGLKA